jgi:succinate dehydrogenase/fumarate reductase flavoprotein subunit
MTSKDPIFTDFLIVGGGPAGCMAAIRAKELNPDLAVTILEKAEISRSGAAGRGMDALNNAVIPGVGTVDEYIEAVALSFDGVLDPTISRVIGERSLGILQRLEGWGLEFPRNEDGSYIVNQFHPKGRFLVEMRGELKKIIAAQTLKAGTQVLNRHPVMDLIKNGEHIAGAIALDLEAGRPRAFVAPAVLLCTGGAARIGLSNTGYLHGTFDCPWCNGESWKMGYEAGASLTGFEYTAQSSMTRDFNGAGQSTFIRHGAWLVNSLGERFMNKYDPKLMERAPAGVRGKAIMEEEKAGRGPVAFVFSHLSPETIKLIESAVFDVERPTMRDYFRKKGIELHNDPVEVVQTEVYLCGGHGMAGLVADAWGETTVPGLFSAGDSLANPAGFLAGAMCMGEAAAERVTGYNLPPPEGHDAAFRLEKTKNSFARHLKGALGVPVRDFEYKFRRLVNEYVAPPKSAFKLQRFLDETESMVRDQDDLPAKDAHGLMKVFEAKAGLFCARMAAQASLFRTESRFGFYQQRTDFPEKDDDNWKTRIIISPGPDGPVLKKENP